ncbi:MAG: radical SAM family heme chaperone HemW [Prevotellaceae bacterium]|jgi:oxygen-independent coproporphyrinogen-3 oxidase|nr:radical SAM family heme chaperone HemW [Prevotellaceae bacterium]
MASLYFHIPFCKQRCAYCDFYTEVAPQFIDIYIDTMIAELYARRDYLLQSETVSSVYFGGGTPSLLRTQHFEKIFYAVNQIFTIDKNAEITFEANPDDLTADYLSEIKNLPFNRVSIGIQSFSDRFLRAVNRRHSAKQAIDAVQFAKDYGFENISVDLIFGLPGQTLKDWTAELKMAFSLDIQHISAYGLTYEDGTPLWKSRMLGNVAPTNEQTMNQMYLRLLQMAENNGFEHYEISNFAQQGFRSQHNCGYWKNSKYLGIGAAAHSFDRVSRQWNVASIKKYIENVKGNKTFFEKEILTEKDKYNEYVMLALRTAEGVDCEYINKHFGREFSDYFFKNIQKFILTEKIKTAENRCFLTPKGILISNAIISEMMISD